MQDDIKGSQRVTFDQDIRHPIFCVKQVQVASGKLQTKCEASLVHPDHFGTSGGTKTDFDGRVLLLEPSKELQELGVELNDQLVQPNEGIVHVAVRSTTISDLPVFPGQVLGQVSIVPQGVVVGRDDESHVLNGIQELDPSLGYRRLVQKLVRDKQAAEIEIWKQAPDGTLRVILQSGERRRTNLLPNGDYVITHKTEDGEEGLYRIFLDLLQQLKQKKYSVFWLDLREWKDKSMNWPEVHDVLAKMFRRQQIKIFFSVPVLRDESLRPQQSNYSEKYQKETAEEEKEHSGGEKMEAAAEEEKKREDKSDESEKEEKKKELVKRMKRIQSSNVNGDILSLEGDQILFQCRHAWVDLTRSPTLQLSLSLIHI